MTPLAWFPSMPEPVWAVVVTLRNHDSRKRWFALPLSMTKGLDEAPRIGGWAARRFQEHARATYMVYFGEPSFAVVPVGGHGTAELVGWLISGPPDALDVEVWELDQLKVGGNVVQFDRKLPYELHIEEAFATKELGAETEPLDVTLKVKRRHAALLVQPEEVSP